VFCNTQTQGNRYNKISKPLVETKKNKSYQSTLSNFMNKISPLQGKEKLHITAYTKSIQKQRIVEKSREKSRKVEEFRTCSSDSQKIGTNLEEYE